MCLLIFISTSSYLVSYLLSKDTSKHSVCYIKWTFLKEIKGGKEFYKLKILIE